MEQKPFIAFIRESECIGCTKCIQACPVDAIVGSAKWMHTVIKEECTGCNLCVAPCPVDCIDMLPRPSQPIEDRLAKEAHHQMRQENREHRLQANQLQNTRKHSKLKDILSERRIYIDRAVARVKQKKSLTRMEKPPHEC